MDGEAVRISSYAEAAGAALGINDAHGYGHAAAALGADGSLLDLTVFSESFHTVHDAMFYVHGLVLFDPTVKRIILLSALRRDVANLMERDVEILRGAQRLFGGCGVEIVDWIQTDGHNVRSIAATTTQCATWRDVA